jgi:uncharacterized protein
MPESQRPIAAITGASSGIGAAFARRLAGEGYDLLLIARRRERLEALAGEVERTHGVQAEVYAADLTDGEALEALAGRLAGEARLALLVNNAGFGVLGAFHEQPYAGQEAMHRLHVRATLRLLHAVLGPMVARDRGAVINVASVAAFMRGPGSASYCATKSWVALFTESVYLDLKRAGSRVQVQALCPGFTLSEFHDAPGLSRKGIPAWLWTTAEYVVDRSLAGLRRDRLYVVPGWIYRLVVAIVPKLPTWLRLRLEGAKPQLARGK